MNELDDIIGQLEGGFMLSEGQFADILKWSGSQHSTIVVDMDTQTILRATAGAELLFGYMMDELNGVPLDTLLPLDAKNKHIAHVQDFNHAPEKRSMGKRGMALHGRRRDGSTFPVEISLLPRIFAGHRIAVANLVSLDKEDE